MRLYDEDSDKTLDGLTLYLTMSEAVQLIGALERVVDEPKDHHVHVSSEDYKKEITVCIYNNEDFGNFNERSKRIIKEDK